jgi:pSer/pThr/pTyr-binding forkhead associated (FHA) protein
MLVIREGEDAGREIPLAGAMTIGRGDDADLTLGDTGISRSHARITPEGVSAVIEDLGSSNGTFVNTQRVEDPRRLRDGDEIQLGNAILASPPAPRRPR